MTATIAGVDSGRCIWCLQSTRPGLGVEHIIPEALGCPKGFVLPSNVVCTKCNNGLSDLDTAVIDEFDFLAFLAGVPRKRGRAPAIRSRGNVVGTVEADEPTISFNMGSTACRGPNGEHLSGYRGGARNVRAQFAKLEGGKASVSFDIQFGQSRKFVRGLLKIAFSSFAYFCGAEIARSEAFMPIRDFVRGGKGQRHALMQFGDDEPFANRVWAPQQTRSGEYCITFRIGKAEFLVDLSPNESSLEMLRTKVLEIYGTNGWFVLPIDQR